MNKVVYACVFILIVCIRVLPKPIAIAESAVSHFSVEDHRPAEISGMLQEVNQPEITSVYDPVLDVYYDLTTFNALPEETYVHFKGIGNVLAKAIVDHRELNGHFNSFYELVEVRGIGDKKLQDILENSK